MHSSFIKHCTVPNFLTLLRGALAFVFLIDSILLRSLAAFLAAIIDAIDGYLARRWNQESEIGSLLDPLMDKFFVFFVISVLLLEERVGTYEVLAIVVRDIVLILFGVYLSFSGKLNRSRITATRVGKAVTAMQFLLILFLCSAWKIPNFTYPLFVLLGLCMLIELVMSRRWSVLDRSKDQDNNETNTHEK